MVNVGGKIPTGGASQNLKSAPQQTQRPPGAASKLSAARNAREGERAGSSANEALAFSLPGTNTSAAAKKASKTQSNVASRFAKAEGQGAQNFAGTGIAQGGGSSTPFIPLDSTKMGFEGLGKIGAGLGKALEAMGDKKKQQEQQQQEPPPPPPPPLPQNG